MNKVNAVIICSLFILLLSNCKKEEVTCLCDDSCIATEEIENDTNIVTTFFPGAQEFGFFTATKINQLVEGSVFPTTDTTNRNFDLLFNTFSEEGFRREEFVVQNIPFELGCYGITNRVPGWINLGYTASGYRTYGGQGRIEDAEDSYGTNLVDRNINKIEIIEIDTLKRIVKGNFAVSFELNDFETINDLNPIFLRFFNGEFEVVY